MVKLEFLVNENYLLAHTLSHDFSPKRDGQDAANIRKSGEQAIHQHDGERITKDGWGVQFMLLSEMLADTLSPDAQELASRLKQMPEYKRILEQVQSQQSELEAKWLTHHGKTERMMQEITGLDFTNDQFTVYLTLLGDGRYMGDRRIVWGSQKEVYAGSHVVDLWHEIMHGKMKTGVKDLPLCDNIEHSVIQLAADNELRVCLKGGQYPPFVGHKHHFPIMKKMLPYWQKYLDSQGRNILDFHKEMEGMSKILTGYPTRILALEEIHEFEKMCIIKGINLK